MILCKYDLQRVIADGSVRIDPPVGPDAIDQVSIDLRLGRKFTVFRELPGHVASIFIDPTVFQHPDMWHTVEAERFVLRPGELVLAQTLEYISLPNHLMGMVEGRSSWGRFGVTIHITAPKIDPGFEGNITLEMVNLSKTAYELRSGVDKPAQLILMEITQPLADTDTYGAGAEDRFFRQREPTGGR